ncbi:hypothetical protein BT96DRAFT_391661 [Gymnopus androsaceus JB14]|uniref:Uncharacterized protein n=1 Tax=Gymnopus androsaceus JB14 TaxID=1447944 RepID=A0A6A4GW84_9AGAR|nr:hypothetical protein BT96DRAFT_391661 [Gymnopus androsaceus JB14]
MSLQGRQAYSLGVLWSWIPVLAVESSYEPRVFTMNCHALVYLTFSSILCIGKEQCIPFIMPLYEQNSWSLRNPYDYIVITEEDGKNWEYLGRITPGKAYNMGSATTLNNSAAPRRFSS